MRAYRLYYMKNNRTTRAVRAYAVLRRLLRMERDPNGKHSGACAEGGNMKKNIEKVLASAGLIVALVLIIILIVTAFGGITPEEFDNQLVRGLIITLSVLYLLLAACSLTLLFLNSDTVREITLRNEQGGSCKATLGVIRKLVKETFRGLEGVKTGKVALIVNEYGVKLKVAVRITDRDVFETETFLRTLLEEEVKGALGFRFHAIEFKIVSLQARFKADMNKVNEEVEEKVAAHVPNYAAIPNLVERVSDGGAEAAETAAPVENESVAAEAEAAAEDTPAPEQMPEEIAAEVADESFEEEDVPSEAEDGDNDKEENETEGKVEADADAEEEE